jgi:streptogramin lyase
MSTLDHSGHLLTPLQMPACTPANAQRPEWRHVRRLAVAAALLATTLASGRPAHAAGGSIAQFHVPGSCICQGIAAGSDGALWFTEFYDNKVGRITTSGSITQFAFPVLTNIARYIAAGRDGALWVTLVDEIHGHGKIGRITTRGATTLDAVPGTSYLDDITAGPDGALWVTDNQDKIDRITTAGQVTEFPVILPSNDYPERITAGPDGNLWFTADSARLGRRGVATGCDFQAGLATARRALQMWYRRTWPARRNAGSVCRAVAATIFNSKREVHRCAIRTTWWSSAVDSRV